MTRILAACTFALALTFGEVWAATAGPVGTAELQEQHEHPATGQTPAPEMEKMEAEMKAMRGKMMEEMQAMDRRLDELVAEMNAAEGAARVDAIAAVVTELVAQRRRMHDHMMQMHGRMMDQMMQHMRGPAAR